MLAADGMEEQATQRVHVAKTCKRASAKVARRETTQEDISPRTHERKSMPAIASRINNNHREKSNERKKEDPPNLAGVVAGLQRVEGSSNRRPG